MNALVPMNQGFSFSDIERLGVNIAKSNLFGIKTPEAAVSLMMLAQAEGLHPATAARDYDIIQGRPAKRAEAMHRQFFEAGGKIKWLALSDTEAKATFSHPIGGEVTLSWDMARATQAGLGTKENYKKFPRQMLRNRLISEGVRTVWPGATGGLYVPEEVADFTGATIDHEPEPPVETQDEEPSERDRINADIPLRAAAADMKRGARIAERAAEYEAPAKPVERTDEAWQVWLDKLRAACGVLYHRSEVVEVSARASVAEASATGPDWVRREVAAILAENFARLPEQPAEVSGWPGDDLKITGEEKVAAG